MEAERLQENGIGQVLLRFKSSKNLVKRAKRLGFGKYYITKEESQRKADKNIAEVGAEKAKRLDRYDTAGNMVTDGGDLVFGKDGRPNLSPTLTVGDLNQNGFFLAKMEVEEKEGEVIKGSGFIRLYYSKISPPISLDEEQEKLIKLILDRTYRVCYAYSNSADEDNPPNRTFNFNGPIVEESEIAEKKDSFRVLRIIDSEARARCPLVHS